MRGLPSAVSWYLQKIFLNNRSRIKEKNKDFIHCLSENSGETLSSKYRCSAQQFCIIKDSTCDLGCRNEPLSILYHIDLLLVTLKLAVRQPVVLRAVHPQHQHALASHGKLV